MLQNLRVRDRFILGKVNEDLEDRPYGMKSFPRCAGTLGKSAANRNLAGNGLRGDRSACGIRQNYISQKKNSGPLHFGSLASRGAYAPLLARTKNRNAKDRLLGHDVRCWKRCNKGRYRQYRAQSRGPTLLKLHRPLSGTLLRFADYTDKWMLPSADNRHNVVNPHIAGLGFSRSMRRRGDYRFAYSARASLRTGTSGSASFQRVRKSS